MTKERIRGKRREKETIRLRVNLTVSKSAKLVNKNIGYYAYKYWVNGEIGNAVGREDLRMDLRSLITRV